MFNPRGTAGVVVLQKEALETFLHLRAGCSTPANIAKTNPSRYAEIVTALLRAEVLSDTGPSPYYPPRRPARQKTLHVWIQVTDACNLSCTYCFVRTSGRQISFSTAISAIENICYNATRLGFSRVVFKLAGGEPTLLDQLCCELILSARVRSQHLGIDTRFALLTNGTRLSGSLLDVLRSQSCGVSVSLDGLGPSHDRNRPSRTGSSTSAQVIETIDALLKVGIRPFILVTVGPDNVNDLPLLATFCFDRNLRFRLSPRRTPDQSDNDVRAIATGLVRFYSWLGNHLPERSLYRLHKFASVDLLQPRKKPCGLGRTSFVVDTDGTVRLCPQYGGSSPICHSRDGDLLERVAQALPPVAAGLNVERHPTCSLCRWRYTCRGGCPLHATQESSTDTRSPHCEIYREVLPALIKVHAEQTARNLTQGGPQ